MRIFSAVPWVLALVTAAGVSAKDPSAGKGLNFYSIEKEIALGGQLAREVERQAKLFDDPILNEYVNRIAQNLARHSDVVFPVSIKIIDSEEINAFTVPGGHLFINSGLIRLTESEAELAAALSHEIGHVAGRHATRQATLRQLVNMGSIPLMAIAGGWSTAAMPLGLLKFARRFETEADNLAIEYMDRAGYDPTASVDLFERVEATERKHPGAVARLFDQHPATADRIERTQTAINHLLPARAEYVVNTSEYEEMRHRLVRLIEERKPAQAASIPPSLVKSAPAPAAHMKFL